MTEHPEEKIKRLKEIFKAVQQPFPEIYVSVEPGHMPISEHGTDYLNRVIDHVRKITEAQQLLIEDIVLRELEQLKE